MIKQFFIKIKNALIWAIAVFFGIILIAFMVTNRALVRVYFNPFDTISGAWSYQAPFFLWLFLFLLIGIFIGSVSTWLRMTQINKIKAKARKKAKDSSHLTDL